HQAKVALLQVPDRPGIAAQLFGQVADADINVDLVIQSINEGNFNDIAFTVDEAMLPQAQKLAESLQPSLQGSASEADAAAIITDAQIAKVSIAGAGMIGRPGVAAKMFSTLAAAGVNIQMISTSEVKVSCSIHTDDCDRAVSTLCNTFKIAHSPIPAASTQPSAPASGASTPAVRGAALDRKQARVAIRHIPDRPGMAARVFELLAEHHISVDTIIQSQRCRMVNDQPTRDIAFTVAQGDASETKALLNGIAPDLGCGDITVDEAIAHLCFPKVFALLLGIHFLFGQLHLEANGH
ncbi:MAG: ACT domain-containing protein, partial [Moorea sp. SIO3C2]|nr:ACT domain-containing protein [Moorena sp. SIO3C2]